MLLDNRVCAITWYKIHDISKASLHEYNALYEAKSRKYCHGNIGII